VGISAFFCICICFYGRIEKCFICFVGFVCFYLFNGNLYCSAFTTVSQSGGGRLHKQAPTLNALERMKRLFKTRKCRVNFCFAVDAGTLLQWKTTVARRVTTLPKVKCKRTQTATAASTTNWDVNEEEEEMQETT